jgi:hypothetical protein
MTDLKTDAAESALREHKALVNGRSLELPTVYHETVTDLRRELVEASGQYRKIGEPHWAAVLAYLDAAWVAKQAGKPEPARPSRAVMDADVGLRMAASYAYTLAAILRLAGDRFGPEVQQVLASAADDILTNGDGNDLNTDIESEEGGKENGP